MNPLLWAVITLGCVSGAASVVICVRNPIIAPADEPTPAIEPAEGEWCDCDECVRVVSMLQARARADATPEEIVRADILLWELEWSPAR